MLYSLPSGERIVSALLDAGRTVIFRPHPFSYDFADDAATIAKIQALLEADARRTGRTHLWGAGGGVRTRHPRLHQRLRRDGLRRLQRGVGLPVLRQAVRHDRRAVRAGGVRGRVPGRPGLLRGPRRPGRPGRPRWTRCSARTRSRRSAPRIRVDYLGDFPAEGYASAFVDAVRHVDRQVRWRTSVRTARIEARTTTEEKPEDEDSLEDGRRRRTRCGPELVALRPTGRACRARPARDRLRAGRVRRRAGRRAALAGAGARRAQRLGGVPVGRPRRSIAARAAGRG